MHRWADVGKRPGCQRTGKAVRIVRTPLSSELSLLSQQISLGRSGQAWAAGLERPSHNEPKQQTTETSGAKSLVFIGSGRHAEAVPFPKPFMR